MTQKKTVKHIGGNYIPPVIKESPKVEFGVATIRLVTALTDKVRRDFQTAFQNCCEQKGLHLSMVIRGHAVTIKRAANKILWEVLKWLGIEQPQPKASMPTPKKPPVMMKSQKRRLSLPAAGLRFAAR